MAFNLVGYDYSDCEDDEKITESKDEELEKPSEPQNKLLPQYSDPGELEKSIQNVEDPMARESDAQLNTMSDVQMKGEEKNEKLPDAVDNVVTISPHHQQRDHEFPEHGEHYPAQEAKQRASHLGAMPSTSAAEQAQPRKSQLASVSQLTPLRLDMHTPERPDGEENGEGGRENDGSDSDDSEDLSGIPPELLIPMSTKCSQAMTNRVIQSLEQMKEQQEGHKRVVTISLILRQQKKYRNPAYLDDLVDRLQLQEYGDPERYKGISVADVAAMPDHRQLKHQLLEEQKSREADRKKTQRIGFKSGGTIQGGAPSVAGISFEDRQLLQAKAAMLAKKNKWDN